MIANANSAFVFEPCADALRLEIRRDALKWAALWLCALALFLMLSFALYPSIVQRISEGMHLSAFARLSVPVAVVACSWRPFSMARRRFERVSAHPHIATGFSAPWSLPPVDDQTECRFPQLPPARDVFDRFSTEELLIFLDHPRLGSTP